MGTSTAFASSEAVEPSGPQAYAVDASEQRLQDALIGLASDSATDRRAAIEQLVGVNDERATSAIIAAANDSEGDDRLIATKALWFHAADLKFAELSSVTALQLLAEDSDPNVSRIAKGAIADMDQYQAK
jgi:HEAT repeat protein